MAWGRVVDIWYDKDSDVMYNSAGDELKPNQYPSIYYFEQVLLRLRVVTDSALTVYDGMSSTDLAQGVIDNDWDHWLDGALTAGFSGAVTSITVDGVATADEPPTTGKLYLTNAAAQSETVDYTAWTYTGGIYTFTVSKTLTYTYLEDDAVKITEGLIAKTENSGVNLAGDWASGGTADITQGEISVRINGNSTVYEAAVQGLAKIANSPYFEAQVWSSGGKLTNVFTFEWECRNIRDDDGAIPAQGSSGYLTIAVGDARYMKKEIDTQVTLTDGAGVDTNITLGASATYRAFTVVGMIDDGTVFQKITFSVYHNGTTAYLESPAYSGDDIDALTWDADIDSGNVRLIATMTSHGNDLKMVYGIRDLFNVSV